MNWTQPVCEICWQREQGDRPPVRVREPDRVQCCLCGVATTSGIYIRRDPETVRFPYPGDEA